MANALTPVIVLLCMDCNKEKEYVRKKIVFAGNVFKVSKYLTLFRKYLLKDKFCLFLKLKLKVILYVNHKLFMTSRTRHLSDCLSSKNTTTPPVTEDITTTKPPAQVILNSIQLAPKI